MTANKIPDGIMEQFSVLSGELSPENLTCDGELSNSEVKIKYKNLMKQWLALERKIGRTVSEDEVFQWVLSRMDEK